MARPVEKIDRIFKEAKLKHPLRNGSLFAGIAIGIACVSVFFCLKDPFGLHVNDIRQLVDRISAASAFSETIATTQSANLSITRTEESLESYQCRLDSMSTVLLSFDPLIIHIYDFVTPFEAEYLIKLGEEELEPSAIGPGDMRRVDKKTRYSFTATLPDVLDAEVDIRDPVIECIIQKAAVFQGHVPISHTEPLQILKYKAGGFFKAHVDPHAEIDPELGNRETSFFVILKSKGLLGTGMGGTRFVNLQRRPNHMPGLCEVVECGDDAKGLTWKPIEGSAIFWRSLHDNKSVHTGTKHMGVKLPDSEKAVKIAMNIWTWNKPYHGI